LPASEPDPPSGAVARPPDAWVARLFADHHVALYRYLVRLTGDDDRAADAAQEAFVRLLTRRTALAGPAPEGAAAGGADPGAADDTAAGRGVGGDEAARAWLFRVATHVALDEARTAGRRRRLLDAAAARAPVADPPPDPLAAAEARERHARVAAALALLAPRDRAALLLRESGFAHREIAAALGTTTGAVGTVLARAVARCAAALRAAVPGGPEAL
jgi:RNA polymerase sigma factor (sigma-70 family)